MKARKKIFKRRFRIPMEDRVVYTEKDKTQNIAKAFESVIIEEPDGSEYVMSRGKFNERYNIVDIEYAETKPVEIEFVYNTTNKPITFVSTWGEDITANPGAAIVIENGRFGYAIQPQEFLSTYDVIEG